MTYCTSFCNHGHRLSDGAPVGHECFIIPPKLLEGERHGDIDLEAWAKWASGPRKRHSGIVRKFGR